MNRLSFGIKTAPSEFNRILSQILNGLTKVEAYFDDIICHGASMEECTNNLISCLERLKENDLHLNKNKCSFFKESINYLGHIVSYNKIQKSPEKIQAVSNMPRPKNAEELRRFLGMVTYYAKFIPDFSTKSFPLRRLLRKDEKFFWSASTEAAFVNLKLELCSERVLTPFDPAKPLILTTDASPTGIAAVLSHEVDGHERPIAYASRALTQAECNYSQLDREALAIVYATTHFYNYVYARNFTLVTDNEPLSRIFHPSRALPQMTSARLLRYASFLSGLDFTVRCKKGKDNENVDCLSRAPLTQTSKSPDTSMNEEVNTLYAETILQISSSAITAETIAEETAKDTELQTLMSSLRHNRRDEPFTISNGMLFRMDRAVIPKSLQRPILDELHASHLGITKMKQLARRYIYWERLDKDIEQLVKSCEACAKVRHNPQKAPIHPWDQPEDNWERLHIDYAGPFDNHYFLMCIDAKSKWAEVRILRDAPSSTSTITLLENIFSVHGYPSVLVSDNAAIFKSEEFQRHCKERGIFQKFIAPGHPATNGLAERSIQTLKRRLKAAADDPTPLSTKLQNILFRYRATPLASGQSPAELYLKRKIRIRLDALLPNRKALVPTSRSNSHVRSFQVGQRVQARIHQNNQDIWQFGIVTEKLGQYHYIILLDTGRSLKRHINQLISTLVPKKHVTFVPQQSQPPRQGVPHIPTMDSPSMDTEPTPLPVPDSNTNQQVLPSDSPRQQASPLLPPGPRRSSRQRCPPMYLNDYVPK
uniref:RNA-directed DNA polymerase n=1 Tax=Lygus hesperus TaxID=30085 RepID=A0A146LPF7_LYGHE